MVFTTTKFELLTRKVATSFGLPDTRVVVVDHPLGGTDAATILVRADAAVDEVIAQLSR